MIAESPSSSTTPVAARVPMALKKLVVAHDASAASEMALRDAVSISRRFQSEIILAHVHSLQEMQSEEDVHTYRQERMETTAELDKITQRLVADGVRARGVVRNGSVGDTLFNLCCEESADMLLLGAYGNGSLNRQTLGSTAEQLLREMPFAVLTYGPHAAPAFSPVTHFGPVLLPVALPCSGEQVKTAIALAKLFGITLDVFHAVDHAMSRDIRWFEDETRTITGAIREQGVRASWSFMYGEPSRTICSKSMEIDSPFIMMPLKWRHGLSAVTSDNVGAHVIRQAKVPVLSYRYN